MIRVSRRILLKGAALGLLAPMASRADTPPIRIYVKAFVDTHLSGPGVCTLMAPNLTITLPTWTTWAEKDSIEIKDMTGSNPNCTVVAAGNGLIDGQTSTTLTNAYESLTFDPFEGGNTWTLA